MTGFTAKNNVICKKSSIGKRIKYSIKRSNFIFPKRNPENIITASNILRDEIFDLYIIKSIKNKTKFYIIQHGGGYGFSKINDEEEYQLNIADYFVTWGWKESSIYKPSRKFFAKVIHNYGCILKKPKTKNTRTNKLNSKNPQNDVFSG